MKLAELSQGARDLKGMRFGRLVVQYYAGLNKHGSACWCCLCDCGNVCRVTGGNLIQKPGRSSQKSCGCFRREHAATTVTRMREAALKIPKEDRAKWQQAAHSVHTKRLHRTFCLDIHAASELLQISEELVLNLAKDGVIRSKIRQGETWVSSHDISQLLIKQDCKKKQCRLIDVMMGLNPELAKEWKLIKDEHSR